MLLLERERWREICIPKLEGNFFQPLRPMLEAGYMDQGEGEMEWKRWGKRTMFSPKSCPPDTDIFGEKQLYSCKVHTARIMAGQFLELQVASWLPPMAGRPRVKRVKVIKWPATTDRCPPRCPQHNPVVQNCQLYNRRENKPFLRRVQKGQVELLAGHQLLVSSHVCTTQISG